MPSWCRTAGRTVYEQRQPCLKLLCWVDPWNRAIHRKGLYHPRRVFHHEIYSSDLYSQSCATRSHWHSVNFSLARILLALPGWIRNEHSAVRECCGGGCAPQSSERRTLPGRYCNNPACRSVSRDCACPFLHWRCPSRSCTLRYFQECETCRRCWRHPRSAYGEFLDASIGFARARTAVFR